MFAVSLEKKSHGMKRQKRKQDALILKMLPKEVVDKLNSGADIAENFESATLFFRLVMIVQFSSEIKQFLTQCSKCKAHNKKSISNISYI